MKRTIENRDGELVEVEIDDPPPTDTFDEMVQILKLAQHIYKNRDKIDSIWMPGHAASPKNRKKKVNESR